MVRIARLFGVNRHSSPCARMQFCPLSFETSAMNGDRMRERWSLWAV
jgi:hypothetical protein